MADTFLTRLFGWMNGPARREEQPDPEGAKLINEMFEKNVSIAESFGVQEGRPVWSEWATERAIKDGMKASVYVYRCAGLNAKSVASVPIRHVDENGEALGETPVQMLMNKPNDYWTRQTFMARLMYFLMLGGNAIIHKNRGGRPAPAPVLELWLIHPDQIKPVPSKEKIVSHYEFKDANGRKRNIPAEDIIHLMLVDPSNMYWGLSVIQAAAKTIDTEVEAITWNKVAMQKRAVADGMFAFDQKLSREQWIEARMRIRTQHAGAKNAREPWVMGNNVKWVPMQMTPVEMDFIKSRKMGREEICTAFGVPPVLVGSEEKSTYNNYVTARLAYWEDTVVPLLVMVEQAITLGLTDDFQLGSTNLVFDLSKNKVLNQLTPDTITVASGLQQMGVPFNIINERLSMGIDEFVGWDVSYLASGLVPASQLQVDPFTMMGESEMKAVAMILAQQREAYLLEA